jgi:hypothetical protein
MNVTSFRSNVAIFISNVLTTRHISAMSLVPEPELHNEQQLQNKNVLCCNLGVVLWIKKQSWMSPETIPLITLIVVYTF